MTDFNFHRIFFLNLFSSSTMFTSLRDLFFSGIEERPSEILETNSSTCLAVKPFSAI